MIKKTMGQQWPEGPLSRSYEGPPKQSNSHVQYNLLAPFPATIARVRCRRSAREGVNHPFTHPT